MAKEPKNFKTIKILYGENRNVGIPCFYVRDPASEALKTEKCQWKLIYVNKIAQIL